MTDDTVEISENHIRVRSERNYLEYGIHERAATAVADVKTLLAKIDELEENIDWMHQESPGYY